jgi:hypothetical protein
VPAVPPFHGFHGVVDEIPETLAEIDVVSIEERQPVLEVKFPGYLVLEKGLGQIEFQFLAAELIEIQGEFLRGGLMHPLKYHIPDKVLQFFEFLAELLKFLLAVAVQGHQLLGAGQGGFGQKVQLLPGLLFQELQLERQDLQRGVHLVDEAQAAAAHAGVAIGAHQRLKAPLQDGIGYRGSHRLGRYRDRMPGSGRGLRPGPARQEVGSPLGINRNIFHGSEIARIWAP